jgi:hypothetical protein
MKLNAKSRIEMGARAGTIGGGKIVALDLPECVIV